MHPIDYDIRKAILSEKGNIVISASAGTGKTHTTVLKIIQEKSENQDYHTFAAITFTRKAAKEISKRLGENIEDGFVGTNDNFVLKEIIQPFMYDVYGIEFKKDIMPDYSSEKSFNTFKEGISIIRNDGLLCKFRNNHLNFTFELALSILKNSKAAIQYLNAKYYRIYIDEYQDSDIDMHNLFMFICKEIKILVFIVGDTKQSIYGWRGGFVEGFKQVISDTQFFNVFKLKHNFRSNIAIQNYSNMFMDDVRDNFQVFKLHKEIVGYAFKDKKYVCEYIKEWIAFKENCVLLARRNEDAMIWSNLLQSVGLDFMYLPASPLDNTDLESEHIWLARVLAFYLLQIRFSEYDVVSEIPSSDAFIFKKIKTLLIKIKGYMTDKQAFTKSCFDLYMYLGYEKTEKVEREIAILSSIINNTIYESTYNPQKYSHIITTIHSSKGLEYEQVIIQASDYNLKNEDDKYLHYVAVSRPSNRLLVAIDYNSKNGKNYVKQINDDIQKTKLLGYEVEQKDVLKGINSPEFSQS